MKNSIWKKGVKGPGLALVCLLSLAAGSGPSHATQGGGGAAGEVAEQPCDPRYWESLTARAWLEAEREIIQNQNLIFKPDSVLEYTCFDKFLDHNAQHAGQIFVHTGYFGKIIIQRGSNESMEKGLTNVVATALNTYDTTNFQLANFLSNRANEIKDKADPTTYAPAATVTPGNYTCNVMQAVWKTSKCVNFIDNEPFKKTDGFYPFRQIKAVGGGQNVAGYEESFSGANDPRQWPQSLKCAGPEQTVWKQWNDLAENTNEAYKFKQPLQKDFTDVRKKIEPGQCGEQPIKTGVKVVIAGQSGDYDDGVCTNPGCTFQKNGACQ